MTTFDPRGYWEERLARSTGLEGVGYLGLGQQFNAWMYRLRRLVFIRTALRHFSKVTHLPVLDVGSGTGEYVRTWSSIGVRSVTGSDLTEVAVSRLRKEFPRSSMIRMDLADAELSLGERYDAVSCMDVLFHVVHAKAFQQALTNLRKALNTGGLLFVSEDIVHTINGGQEHFAQRTLATYEEALKRNGFDIIQRRPMFHLMNAPLDSDSRWLHRWWSAVMFTCRHSYTLGGLLAMLVFPLEYLFVMVRKEGVSTEIMVCKAV